MFSSEKKNYYGKCSKETARDDPNNFQFFFENMGLRVAIVFCKIIID